jgi:A/G-specific adenine glycosylase
MNIEQFQNEVLSFYEDQGRSLPWRETTDPYKVWVSEIMLQQTQVSRVVPKYESWIKSYPDVESLASAEMSEVMEHWVGLGYNNRAKWLRDGAKHVVREHGGEMPRSEEELLEIKGVGPYTANAILIFAYNADRVTVDTNIRRVYIAWFDLDEDDDEAIRRLAEQCLPSGRSREWHNALMDFGSLQYTSQKTGVSSKGSQSTFEGSTRQVRGVMVRRLTEKGSVTVEWLEETYPDRFRAALNGLRSDGVVTVDEGVVQFNR